MKKETKKRILQSFLLLSILGFIFSIYLVKNHYALPSEGAICDVGDIASCSLVNTSRFSEILNIPVAFLGALWFAVTFILSWKALRKDGAVMTQLFVWAVLGMLAVVYFIIAEIILQTLCIFCTVVHGIIALLFVLSLLLFFSEKRSALKLSG
ncbi:MAG: vitamin K epoxide reductase family protein [Nanoarchaeota archaeon]|nr:vitamin K epoxide reductase family protein [Nanoarchaeota archaeon]